MFFISVWCSLGLKIWPGEPKSVGSNLRAFIKHPPCIASVKPFNISKWKMLTTSSTNHSKRSSLIRPNSLHLNEALLKVWLQQAHWTLVPKLKVLSVYFSPCMCCTALRPLIHIHAIWTTPKWIMRQEAPNWIVMACVWEGVIMHTCVPQGC